MNKKLKKVDYNIEYAHIYTDERFGREHRKSIEEFHNIIERLKRLKKSYVSTVLIDEYNSTQHKLNIKNFLEKLGKLNAKPDFVAFESKLAPYKSFILNKTKGKLKKEYENYIEKHKKIPCSLLIAIWYLKRLGVIKTKKRELKKLTKNNKPFVGKKIITILPRKYKKVEIKALKLIRSTKFRRYLDNIINIFFK